MNFTFTTKYNKETMIALAKALRKTLRQRRGKRSRMFAVLIALAGIWLMLKDGFVLDWRTIVTALAVFVLLTPNLWEDRLNARVAMKRMVKGLESSTTTFTEGNYFSATELGDTTWSYEKVTAIAEMEHYFVFLFDSNHGQVYDKRNLSGGTVEEFRKFISEKTGKEVTLLK